MKYNNKSSQLLEVHDEPHHQLQNPIKRNNLNFGQKYIVGPTEILTSRIVRANNERGYETPYINQLFAHIKETKNEGNDLNWNRIKKEVVEYKENRILEKIATKFIHIQHKNKTNGLNTTNEIKYIEKSIEMGLDFCEIEKRIDEKPRDFIQRLENLRKHYPIKMIPLINSFSRNEEFKELIDIVIKKEEDSVMLRYGAMSNQILLQNMNYVKEKCKDIFVIITDLTISQGEDHKGNSLVLGGYVDSFEYISRRPPNEEKLNENAKRLDNSDMKYKNEKEYTQKHGSNLNCNCPACYNKTTSVFYNPEKPRQFFQDKCIHEAHIIEEFLRNL